MWKILTSVHREPPWGPKVLCQWQWPMLPRQQRQSCKTLIRLCQLCVRYILYLLTWDSFKHQTVHIKLNNGCSSYACYNTYCCLSFLLTRNGVYVVERNGSSFVWSCLDIDVHINSDRHHSTEQVERSCIDWLNNHATHLLHRSSANSDPAWTAQCKTSTVSRLDTSDPEAEEFVQR